MRGRPIAPAAPRLAGYPRLKAAWRLLLGAAPLAFPSLAGADSSVPAPGPQHTPGQETKAPKPPRAQKPQKVPRIMGDISVAEPPDPPPPPPPAQKPIVPEKPVGRPKLNGGPARVMPPSDANVISFYFTTDGDHDLVLHPHGPDEPCIRFDAPQKRDA